MEICLVWVFIGRFSFKFILLERKAGEVRYTVTLGCVLCGCFAKSSAFKGAGQMLAVVCGHTMAADPKKNGWGEEPFTSASHLAEEIGPVAISVHPHQEERSEPFLEKYRGILIPKFWAKCP